MNKQEKEENITQIADTVAFEMAHTLYTEINEHIFDRDLAEESDDKKYQEVYKKIYNKVINELTLSFDDKGYYKYYTK